MKKIQILLSYSHISIAPFHSDFKSLLNADAVNCIIKY